jgi:hypothetical protein
MPAAKMIRFHEVRKMAGYKTITGKVALCRELSPELVVAGSIAAWTAAESRGAF